MGASLTSCNNKTTATDLSSDSIASEVPDIGISVGASDIEAIEQYLVSEIGKNYAEAEYCVPLLRIVNKEEQEDGEILVWGDYCVFNYNLVGDTLKCVSGGNHPGLMHVCLADDNLHFVVTAFEQVEDGAGNLESAKRIFGDNARSIFVAPPSIAELRKRLINRATDAPEKIEERVAKASSEMEKASYFDTVIVNDNLEKAKMELLNEVSTFLAEE